MELIDRKRSAELERMIAREEGERRDRDPGDGIPHA